MIDEEPLDKVNHDNLFVYSFANPKIYLKENDLTKYNNIFNIYNSKDMFQQLYPSSFGFHTVGIDVDLYDRDKFLKTCAYRDAVIDVAFKEYQLSFSLAKLEVVEVLDSTLTIEQFISRFISHLSFDSRKFYVDELQPVILPIVDYFFDNMNKETIGKYLLDNIKGFSPYLIKNICKVI